MGFMDFMRSASYPDRFVREKDLTADVYLLPRDSKRIFGERAKRLWRKQKIYDVFSPSASNSMNDMYHVPVIGLVDIEDITFVVFPYSYIGYSQWQIVDTYDGFVKQHGGYPGGPIDPS